MPKGFNPNPKPGHIYSSIKAQIELLIKQFQNDKESIPVFKTTEKRFAVLKQVVNEIALDRSDLYFKVFSDEHCCIVTEHIPIEQGFSYVWLEQSKISGKWLVIAQPPGATRYETLTVWNKQEDANKVALEILSFIKKFPLDEWDKKYESKYYHSFIKSIPPDDDSIIGIKTPDGIVSFDINTQEELEVCYKQLVNFEITKEEFLQKVSAIV